MKKLLKDGLKIRPANQAECELADYAVCMPADTPSPFTDNLIGVCSRCGVAVIHRPYMPTRPPKICFPCFTVMELEPLKPN